MKNMVLIFICLLTIQYCYSQNYFVTDIEGRDQVLAISTGSNFGGIKAADNYNLLATILGDSPYTLLKPGQKLIDKVNLTMGDVNFDLQPFVYRESGNSRMKNLPIGPKLSQFLSDPLQGEKFDLSLPFIDGRVALSARSGFIRLGNDSPGSEYHTAIDFDRSDDNTKSFEIIAAADGVVLRNRDQVLVISHTTPKGKIFLTIYQHLNADSKSKLQEHKPIKRGDRIGTLQTGGYTHLHFAVAVLVHGGLVGNVLVPERYYLIDPLGVYEERKNSNDINLYNYLPKNNIGYRLRGVKAINVFRTNPINGSFFVGLFMPQENWTNTPFFGDKGTYFTDVDGDQKADAIAVNQAQPIKVCQSNGLSFNASSLWTDIPYFGDKGTYFADVTGDGMDDAIVVLQNIPIVVRRSIQDRFSSNENWTNIPCFGDKGQFFADVTGDGKSDAIVVNEHQKVVVRRSSPSGTGFNLNEEWTDIPFFGDKGTFFADVTGDGLADAIAVNQNQNIVVRRSNGNGFLPNEVWTDVPFFGSKGTFFADVTGDGLADAIAVNSNGIIIRRSCESSFAPNEVWSSTTFFGDKSTFFADVNGDGKADAIAVNTNGILVRKAFIN